MKTVVNAKLHVAYAFTRDATCGKQLEQEVVRLLMLHDFDPI
jgi:hypothetical protein